MIVCDNPTATEALSNLFKTLGRISAKVGKRLATNVLENPAGALGTGAKNGSADASKNLKANLSSVPDVKPFYHTGKRVYFGKVVYIQNYSFV